LAVDVARKAYRSIDVAISQYTPTILIAKKIVAVDRAKIAHPSLSQEHLDDFIENLGGSNPGLLPLQIRLFTFLRTTSISTANIQSARTS